jgi:meiotically up-regulated gene 157 (Mug157) protein
MSSNDSLRAQVAEENPDHKYRLDSLKTSFKLAYKLAYKTKEFESKQQRLAIPTAFGNF